MKNKKEFNDRNEKIEKDLNSAEKITLVVIIILIFGAISILFILNQQEKFSSSILNGHIYHQFKITKQECHTESTPKIIVTNYTYHEKNCSTILQLKPKDLLEPHPNNDYNIIEWCDAPDKIITSKVTYDNLTREVCETKELDKLPSIEGLEDVPYAPSMSKEDLTIKWLDEHCMVYWCNLDGSCDYFKGIGNEFNQWKCGNYKVEAIR